MAGRATEKNAQMGVFVALAMILSYIEVLIPVSIGIPGAKLGLANLVIVVGLYLLTPGEVFLISLVRIFLMGFLFGNGLSLIYSLAGGMASFFVMLPAKKWSKLSILRISILGAVFHHVGQVLAATIVLKSPVLAAYLPVLFVVGAGTGLLIGFLSKQIIHALKKTG